MNDYVTFPVFMLNYYDLGLLRVGLKSFVISVDYEDYMGSSLETWLLVGRFYTWTLIFGRFCDSWYRSKFSIINAVFVYLKTKEFLNKMVNQHLSYARGRILLAHIRTIAGYLSTDLGGFIYASLAVLRYGCVMTALCYPWSNGRGSLHMWISYICR